VEIEYEKSVFGGEKVSLKIAPSEASIIDAEVLKPGQRAVGTKIATHSDHFEISRLVNVGSDAELSAVVKFLVANNSVDLVEKLAAQLESEGLTQAAALVRREAARANRMSPPRLLD
jgi:hypothetical protein